MKIKIYEKVPKSLLKLVFIFSKEKVTWLDNRELL